MISIIVHTIFVHGTRMASHSVHIGMRKKHIAKEYVHVWDLWLSGLCTCIEVTDPEFDPGHKSVFRLSLSACLS